MDTTGSYDHLIGCDAYDAAGDKLGEVKDVYYDDVTRRPEWAAISTGMFGTRQSLVPLAGARIEGDELVVSVRRDLVKEAPHFDADEHLDAAAERELYEHYGFDWDADSEAMGYGYGDAANVERFDSGYETGWRDEWMGRTQGPDGGEVVAEETVRNEQAEVVERERPVRLRKYQWTEQVPVHREEVRMEEVAEGDPVQTQHQSQGVIREAP